MLKHLNVGYYLKDGGARRTRRAPSPFLNNLIIIEINLPLGNYSEQYKPV